MPTTSDAFRSQCLDELAATLPGQTSREGIEDLLARPPNFELGQAAFACHGLAKQLRKSPVTIAGELAAALGARSGALIARVDAAGGFVNFHCDFQSYGSWLLGAIRGGRYFAGELLSPAERGKISVEFSQPNTHKALHIGHLRNMIYGDAVCRLLSYAGHRVVRATYPGDLGAHIAKALWHISRSGENLPETSHADWLGRMYVASEEAVRALEGTPEADQARAQIGKILAELEAGQGEIYQLYLRTRGWSLDEMRRVYAWLGIAFDVWYFETECEGPARELVKRKHKEGFFVKSEGALGIDLSAHGLGFALFLKSDGNSLYLTKDLELIRKKFEDPEVTQSIVIVDSRQKLHFRQLFKTAELMGYPQAAKSVHLPYEIVTTSAGKACSSRSREGMQLWELREMIEGEVTRKHLEAYRGEWSSERLKQVALDVGLGAIKYGFLKVDSDRVIQFELDEWLKLDGETGPYLQYVQTRCRSILAKLGEPASSFEVRLETQVEQELLVELGRFNDTCLRAATGYKPSVLTAYLFDLGKLFNRFYKDCPIRTAEGDSRETRLALVDSTGKVMRKGLELLGIPAPERM